MQGGEGEGIIIRRMEYDKFQERVASHGGAVLHHPYDIVQLEHMISVDCLQ